MSMLRVAAKLTERQWLCKRSLLRHHLRDNVQSFQMRISKVLKFSSCVIICDFLDLEDYLLNLQTSYLRLMVQFKQKQKRSYYIPIFSQISCRGIHREGRDLATLFTQKTKSGQTLYRRIESQLGQKPCSLSIQYIASNNYFKERVDVLLHFLCTLLMS